LDLNSSGSFISLSLLHVGEVCGEQGSLFDTWFPMSGDTLRVHSSSGKPGVCPAPCSSTWFQSGNCTLWLPFQCPVASLQDVVKGLFVCCLFLEYVSLSRRFIPELLNFLLGVLYIATPNKQSQGELNCQDFFEICLRIRKKKNPYSLWQV
jgi:hypothetical protein